ncbi:DUF397 domain-containing protein [Streptomyces sp. NPDC102384]|uniref:DUF397 domain-containing protein n=1 Tax=Streptomyces sp. NPDC102384 TaxID=3366166 RepID=UPI0037FC8818
MGTDTNPTGAQWRKSSHSGGTGGECVEVAAPATGTVAVRDSKEPGLGHFQVSPEAFRRFVEAVAARGV